MINRIQFSRVSFGDRWLHGERMSDKQYEIAKRKEEMTRLESALAPHERIDKSIYCNSRDPMGDRERLRQLKQETHEFKTGRACTRENCHRGSELHGNKMTDFQYAVETRKEELDRIGNSRSWRDRDRAEELKKELKDLTGEDAD